MSDVVENDKLMNFSLFFYQKRVLDKTKSKQFFLKVNHCPVCKGY